MTFSFRPAVRESVGVLVGLAGSSGSGKTYSALRLATGLAGKKPFALIDTENGRALHYADLFKFEHGPLEPPFRPAAYADAIKAADDAGYPVIVVDSFSHEHAGEGGLLDWHEEELDRMAGDDWKRREAVKFSAWIKPKHDHKAMVQKLLQVRAHLILCFRAEEKIEIVKGPDGKVKVQPKKTLTGMDGWVPICEKNLPYELTASFLLTADAPGVPKPIKLQEQHRQFFPLDQPITEESGVALGGWARGGAKPSPQGPLDGEKSTASNEAQAADTGASTSSEWAAESDVTEVLVLAARAGEHDKTVDAISKHRAKYDNNVSAVWLGKLRVALEKKAPAEESEPESSQFQIPESVRAG